LLENLGMEYSADMIKLELTERIKSVRGQYNKYVVHDATEKIGHMACIFPPYHCSLNPTELIWSAVKGYVARNNNAIKLQDVHALLQRAVQKVTVDW
jgi:transposase